MRALKERGAIIWDMTGLIFEADDADSWLLHELDAPHCELTIGFPDLEWIGDSGRLEQEPTLQPLAPVDEPVGQISAEASTPFPVRSSARTIVE